MCIKRTLRLLMCTHRFGCFFLLSIQALKGETFLTKFVIVLFFSFFKCFGQVFTQRVIDYHIIRRCHDRLITVCKNFWYVNIDTLSSGSHASHPNEPASRGGTKQNKTKKWILKSVRVFFSKLITVITKWLPVFFFNSFFGKGSAKCPRLIVPIDRLGCVVLSEITKHVCENTIAVGRDARRYGAVIKVASLD